MNTSMKNRLTAWGLTAVMTLTLSACGAQKPSLAEVEQAIDSGTLTIEDALQQGWVEQAWVDRYIEENSVPASDKMEEYRVGDFQTTTCAGTVFTRDQVQDVTLFAFVDPATEQAQSFFEEMQAAYPAVQEAGAALILCVKGEAETGQFADAPFPVIAFNASLQNAMGFHKETVTDPELPNTAAWYVSGSFLSSWYAALDRDGISQDAAIFVAAAADMREQADAQQEDAQKAGAAAAGTAG